MAISDSDFTSKMDYYNSVRIQNAFMGIWSIYKVVDMNDEHPWENIKRVSYSNHWGENREVSFEVEGKRWIDLYVAANRCIAESGDEHHIFIETFYISKNDSQTLELVTGS